MSMSKNDIINQIVGIFKSKGLDKSLIPMMEQLTELQDKQNDRGILAGVVGMNRKLIGQNQKPVIEVMSVILNGDNAGQLKSDTLWLSERASWKFSAVMKGCGVPKTQRDSFEWDSFSKKSEMDQILYLESMLLKKKFKPVFETVEYNGNEYENIKYYNYTSEQLMEDEVELLDKTVGNYDKIIAGSIDKGAIYPTASRGQTNASIDDTNTDDLPF